ncbi:Smr/MutS family protein [Aureimonas populi]|uniref:Smr/MutS family protein n=1 Tax=Aureimonas populi TaxID=1701758 RepID=A0ABW5CR30_9HYPH|nr:Smr/MutS family protein [Aureimonas populi]
MRRVRHLSAEERRLWGEIARTARPLPGKQAPPEPAPAPAAPEPAKAFASPAALAAPAPPRAPAAPAAPRLHPIERPVRRRIGKGRIPIEARIDLHGLTEAVAHGALLGFLRRAQVSGLRHVLVITGRGASSGSLGALKRALPHWLETPDFRALVAGFETAERNHGGAGAFYLRMRRR